MQYILDRFEEHLAVLAVEDRTTLTVPVCCLPGDARPGDVFTLENGTFVPQPEETERRRRRIREKMRRLWK